MARSRATARNQTQERKRDALGYEMWMLRETRNQITKWDEAKHKQTNPGELHLNFAVLESFLVHARNLLRFFYPAPNPNRDDLVPGDFFADSGQAWRAAHPTIPSLPRRWLGDINTALQHLSRRRPPRRIIWNEEEIGAAIDQLFAAFNAFGPIGGSIVAAHPDRSQRGRSGKGRR